MDQAIAYLSLATVVAGIWLGLKKPQLSAFGRSVLFALDLILLGWSVFVLRWTGVSIFLAAMVLGAILWGLWLAVRQQDILAQAAVASDAQRSELETLQKRLRKSHREFRHIGPLDQARLIRNIAERNRSIDEIEQMANPVATLWVAYRPAVELKELVVDFDRLLRIWKTPANKSSKNADKLTGAIRHSAGGYRDVIDGLMAFDSMK